MKRAPTPKNTNNFFKRGHDPRAEIIKEESKLGQLKFDEKHQEFYYGKNFDELNTKKNEINTLESQPNVNDDETLETTLDDMNNSAKDFKFSKRNGYNPTTKPQEDSLENKEKTIDELKDLGPLFYDKKRKMYYYGKTIDEITKKQRQDNVIVTPNAVIFSPK